VLAGTNILHLLPLQLAFDKKSQQFLGDMTEVYFANSLGAFAVQLIDSSRVKPRRQNTKQMLCVSYGGQSQSANYLSHVVTEAESIRRHFDHNVVLKDQDANLESLRTFAEHADNIHFGCHGYFDAIDSENSGLFLHDGRLTSRDIVQNFFMKLLNTKLITLAACDSNLSEIVNSDELSGLSQAFFSTGAECVIASQWKVDDVSTSVLFDVFYENYQAGYSPAQALQRATHEVRKNPEWQHPYYWASFKVYGLPLNT
jgi:CHAT domain-containing protein